ADQVSRWMEHKWGWGAFVPINLPFTPYGRIVRDAERLERELLDWVRSKRGQADGDLAALIVNSPDVEGSLSTDAAIVGQLPSLIAASSEASQSALTFTLLMLMQHPRVARHLLDELRAKLRAPSPSLHAALALRPLPCFAAVVRESMRILPPVPLQIRVAQSDAPLAGHGVPRGSRVILNGFLTARMSDMYPDGDVFQPERWFTITPSTFEWPVFSG